MLRIPEFGVLWLEILQGNRESSAEAEGSAGAGAAEKGRRSCSASNRRSRHLSEQVWNCSQAVQKGAPAAEKRKSATPAPKHAGDEAHGDGPIPREENVPICRCLERGNI